MEDLHLIAVDVDAFKQVCILILRHMEFKTLAGAVSALGLLCS